MYEYVPVDTYRWPQILGGKDAPSLSQVSELDMRFDCTSYYTDRLIPTRFTHTHDLSLLTLSDLVENMCVIILNNWLSWSKYFSDLFTKIHQLLLHRQLPTYVRTDCRDIGYNNTSLPLIHGRRKMEERISDMFFKSIYLSCPVSPSVHVFGNFTERKKSSRMQFSYYYSTTIKNGPWFWPLKLKTACSELQRREWNFLPVLGSGWRKMHLIYLFQQQKVSMKFVFTVYLRISRLFLCPYLSNFKFHLKEILQTDIHPHCLLQWENGNEVLELARHVCVLVGRSVGPKGNGGSSHQQ